MSFISELLYRRLLFIFRRTTLLYLKSKEAIWDIGIPAIHVKDIKHENGLTIYLKGYGGYVDRH